MKIEQPKPLIEALKVAKDKLTVAVDPEYAESLAAQGSYVLKFVSRHSSSVILPFKERFKPISVV